ncbi:MAG TPA: hypothetical protein VF516_02050, partial [Kofleriaceae bacterium]
EPTAGPAAPPAPVTVAPPPSPAQSEKPPESPSVSGKWTTSFYGFAEGDLIYDTVQGATNGGGPTEALGNGALPRPASGTAQMVGQFRALHDQFQTTARNTRLGFRFTAPTVNDLKATGNIEFDFGGNQPNTVSEASLYVNATMRLRHAYFKLETPFLDIMMGQTWQLFGWQPNLQPGSVQFQGLPGWLSSRTAQLRLGKTVKAGDVTVDVQVAATRPGQRGGGLPDGTGGLRLAYDKLKAARIVGGAGSALDSAMIGVSVIGRRFNVTELKAGSTDTVQKNGYGLAVDALLPIVPATKESKANALTLGGEFVTGGGIADLYTGLNGGVSLPATIPGTMPAAAFAPNIDNGLVGYLTSDASVHAVRWQSFGAFAQYFLPPKGNVVVIVNYSHLSSDNTHNFGAANAAFEKQDYVDGDLMFDVTPAVRFGAGFVWLKQTYVDGVEAHDYRGQLSAMFIF